MIIQANVENRRWLAYTVVGALATALATKVGEWVVEELRERTKGKKP